MKKIIIVGSGFHAKVITDEIIRAKKYKILGYIDPFKKKGNPIKPFYDKLEMLGGFEYFNKKIDFEAIIAIGSNHKRLAVYKKIIKVKKNIK